MLQIAANPYVTILGPERTASSRLNLAQAFNSLGTTLGPLVGGYLIFQYFVRTGAHGAESVKVPYLAFCIVFTVLAAIFFFVHLPDISEGEIEPGFAALKFPHVDLGMLAIFLYVGGEVSDREKLGEELWPKAIANARAFVDEKFGKEFLPEQPNVFKSKKSAQVRKMDGEWRFFRIKRVFLRESRSRAPHR